MSNIFPHRVLKAKDEGFIFVVVSENDDVPDLVSGAAQAEQLLNDNWETSDATSGMKVKDAKNTEEVDMVYADMISLLEDLDFPLVECLIITSVIVVGELVIVNVSLGDGDEDEDEDDEEYSEEDFE